MRKRNIARRRMVIHSSAYDKNSCGHLVTCGNPQDKWSERKYNIVEQYADATESIWNMVDEQNTTWWETPHTSAYFDIVFQKPVRAKGYRIFSNQYDGSLSPKTWRLSGSKDGIDFQELDYRKYDEIPPYLYTYITEDPIPVIHSEEAYKVFRFEALENNGSQEGVAIGEFDLIGVDNTSLLKAFDGHFEQCWKSKGAQEEWLLLDLGANSYIEEMMLNWGGEYALDYEIQSSIDGEAWNTCYVNTDGRGSVESFDVQVSARFLKLLLHSSTGDYYVLREWKVFGTNDLESKETAWKLERASEVSADGQVLSTAAYDDTEWFPAVVPGTVLTSYMEAGAVVDYNNDDNYMQQSDAYFTTNWWYRTKLQVDEAQKGKRIWLNFDAINWKADIYFNGECIGDIKGAFLRKKIDITDLVKYGEDNYLAVLIHCNNFPGPQKVIRLDDPYFINGGVTGLDEPCLAAGIGWDWIETVSGRNIGIYKDVYVTYTGDVQLLDPWFETCKIDYHKNNARLALRTELYNSSRQMNSITLKCVINDGLYSFSEDFLLPGKTRSKFDMESIVIRNAKLWYPVGYGTPELYHAKLDVLVNGVISDTKEVSFGIREFRYWVDDNRLFVSCNNKKLCVVGGNWGMDDATMRNSKRDYDIKVRMHADMNVNLIRNWVGQVNDEDFYEACDRYGVMVWDDFWLANPGDGPEPLDVDMFMENAKDKIRKVRKHPSVLLYCGRNEGHPTEPLYSMLPKLVHEMDPKRYYVSHSAEKPVSGFGPYSVQIKEFYFNNTPKTIHSERGVPNIPVLSSVQKFLNPKNQWPINDTWVSHGFLFQGAQHCDQFCERVEKMYGQYNSLADFTRISQMLCYETYKAIFEAVRAVEGNGMLLWMTSSAMPSFVFQTYDYYYALNGGYMGTKLANQPIYAYHNPITHKVMLDNRSGSLRSGVSVVCKLYDIKGNVLLEKQMNIENCEIGQEEILQLDVYDNTVFLKTVVQTGEGKVYRNFEWIYSNDDADLGLNALEKATVSVETDMNVKTVLLKNIGQVPALLIQCSIVDAETKESVLPIFWSDNFISLMPGEEQIITYEPYDNLNGRAIEIAIDGFNI